MTTVELRLHTTMVSDTTFDVSCSQSRYVHSGSCRITRAPRGVKITGRSKAVDDIASRLIGGHSSDIPCRTEI
jgi:hypothetical protein